LNTIEASKLFANQEQEFAFDAVVHFEAVLYYRADS